MAQAGRHALFYLLLFGRILSLFGVFAVYYDEKKRTHHFSLKKVLYSFFLASLILCGLYYQVSGYFDIRSESSLLNGLLYLYPMVAESLMSVMVILSGLASSYMFISFINKNENLWMKKSIESLNVPGSYKNEFFISAVIFIVPYLVDSFLIYYDLADSIFQSYQGLSYIFVIYNYIALNQNLVALLTVKLMYQSLNDGLLYLTNGKESSVLAAVKKWKKILPKKHDLNTVWNNFRQELALRQHFENSQRVEELYQSRRRHHLLFQLCRQINKTFSLLNLLLVAHHCILGVIYSYWSLRQVLAKNTSTDWAELFIFSRGAVMSFLSIIWLIRPATSVSTEVDRTSQIIQKIVIVATNPDFETEVSTFSLQLLLEKVSFSPYGFFELSRGLLLAMGGVIVSYLVILLQYQIMLDDQSQSIAKPTHTSA